MADTYGTALFRELIRQNVITHTEAILVTGSAYYNTPTAAVSVAEALTLCINQAGYRASLLHMRCNPYGKDYGAMDTTQRRALLDKTALRVDAETAKSMLNARLVIVDDVRITGLHESSVRAFCAHLGVKTTYFCYVAIIDSAQGWQNPSVEDHLNHAYVRGLAEVAEIMRGDFRPNARTCKLVLGASPMELQKFAIDAPKEKLHKLMDCARADGYHMQPHFRRSFMLLKQLLEL